MYQIIKHILSRVFIATLVVGNVFFGFPVDSLIGIVNERLAESKIVDTLYLALCDPSVVDRERLRIPTTLKRANAATVSVEMAERYVGARSNSTTSQINEYAFDWVAPTGIANLAIEARGGGGGGGGSSATNGGGGGGGGGGGYARSTNVSVSAGSTYAIRAGTGGRAGGTAGSGVAGVSSTFDSTTVVAAGGGLGAVGPSGAAGAGGTSNTGDTTFDGGAGSAGVSGTRSGAGGGGAGDTEDGGAAVTTTGGTGGSAGGGNGADGSASTGNVAGVSGNIYGGGGSGGKRGNSSGASRAGGHGASGLIDLTYDYDADDTFPIIRGISGSRTNNSDSTSHDITLPPGVQTGELLVVIFTVDASETVNVGSGSGWTKLGQANNPGTITMTSAVYWKVADGDDALTLTTTTEQSSHLVYRIANHGSTVTGTSAGGDNVVNSDPPEHTPAGGADNYLWIATRSADAVFAATSTPSGYSFWRQSDSQGTSGVSTDAAVRFANGSSEDPAVWGNATSDWVSWTLAVPVASPTSAPTVTTDYASNVGATSARFHGSIVSDGGDSITQHGFAYSTNSTLSSGVSTTTLGSGSEGAFQEFISGLSNDQTYYFRAYAVNSSGTSTGAILNTTSGNTTPTRSVRLFGGQKVKFYGGTNIIIYPR